MAERSDRFSIQHTPRREREESFADAVSAGLEGPAKSLPCRFLYDATGSALFESICELPEYYPTRTERGMLERSADDIAAAVPGASSLVELGSGSATKTRLVIDALLARQERLRFVPIDISRSALTEGARALLDAYPTLEVHAIEGEYEAGLAWLAAQEEAGARLLLWLGSSIGNLDREEASRFLSGVARGMRARDRLLVGIDLRKDAAVLERAYDDDAGVTARFNLNLLERINKELDGQFELDRFEHNASYHEAEGRVEMTLVSLEPQTVEIPGLDLRVAFERGEAIHTENAFKYSSEEIDGLGEASGLALEQRWYDPDGLFSLNLFRRP